MDSDYCKISLRVVIAQIWQRRPPLPDKVWNNWCTGRWFTNQFIIIYYSIWQTCMEKELVKWNTVVASVIAIKVFDPYTRDYLGSKTSLTIYIV